jgi:hypothetical protein
MFGLLVVVLLWERIRNVPIFQVFVPFLACVIIAFSFGITAATAHLEINQRNTYALHETDGRVLHGRLLIGGERGVLFFDFASTTTRFQRWQNIVFIERTSF